MDATVTAAASPATPPWATYVQEARCESMRLLRAPSFAVPCLLFPPLFYLLFGVLMGHRGGSEAARYLLAGYGAFGVLGVSLFGFGVTVAMDREQGLLTLKRAQPMPPGAYLAAKVAMAVLFTLIVQLLVAALAISLGGVRLSAVQWLGLVAVNVGGVLPFSALGLWLGTVVGARGAPALINLVYLPMAFLSGLWLPLSMLPQALQSMAPLWPAYHLAVLARAQVGLEAAGAWWPHVLVLGAVTALFLFLARRRLAR